MILVVTLVMLLLPHAHTAASQQRCRVSDLPELTTRVRSPQYDPSKETYVIVGLFPAKLKTTFNLSGFIWIQVAKFAFLEMLEKIPELTRFINLELVIYDTCSDITIATAIAVSTMLDARNVATVSTNKTFHHYCEEQLAQNVIGFVGPASSSVTMHFAWLFPEDYPVISYSATSVRLDQKELYLKVMRTIPPDDAQANVIVDVVKLYKWTYISIVAYDDDYGRMGMEELRKRFEGSHICTAVERIFRNNNDTLMIVNELRKEKHSRVVIIWAPRRKTIEFLDTMIQQNLTGKVFILSETMSSNSTIPQYDAYYMQGMISIAPNSFSYPAFDKYFGEFSYNETSDPWLKRFYQKYANNSRNTEMKHFANFLPSSKKECVRSAIYTYGHAIRNFLQEPRNNCTTDQTKARNCMERITKSRKAFLMDYLHNVTFNNTDNEKVAFDEKGNTKYEHFIVSSLQMSNNKLQWIKIGEWQKDRGIDILNTSFMWPGNQRKPPSSNCSTTCPVGYEQVEASKPCCWHCVACQGETVKSKPGLGQCYTCPVGSYPNRQHTECIPVKYIYSTISGMPLFIVYTLMVTNSVICILYAGIFIKYRATPIVHSSQFHLTMTQLVFLLLVNLNCVVKTLKPTKTLCIAFSATMPFLLTLAIAPTILKTQRLVTVFRARNRILTKRYILIKDALKMFAVIFIQIALFVVTYFFGNTSGKIISFTDNLVDTGIVQVGCINTLPFYTEIAFLLFIFMVCGVATFKSRNLPTNYNEIRTIAYTMFTCSVLLIFVIPLHESVITIKSKAIAVVLTILLLDFIFLVFLYTRKVWVILFRPELNTNKHFIANRIKNINNRLEQKLWQKAVSKDRKESFHQIPSNQRSPLIICKGNNIIENTGNEEYDDEEHDITQRTSAHSLHVSWNTLVASLHTPRVSPSLLRRSFIPSIPSTLVTSEKGWLSRQVSIESKYSFA